MSKLEQFIRKNYDLTEEELKSMPRILNRCDEEIEESCMGQLSEYAIYDIVDDELSKIDEENTKKLSN